MSRRKDRLQFFIIILLTLLYHFKLYVNRFLEFFLKNKKYLYFRIKYAIIQVRRYRIYLAVLVCTDLSDCSVYVACAHKYQEMLRVQLNISAGVFYVLSENCFLNSFSAFFVKINRKNSNGAEN